MLFFFFLISTPSIVSDKLKSPGIGGVEEQLLKSPIFVYVKIAFFVQFVHLCFFLLQYPEPGTQMARDKYYTGNMEKSKYAYIKKKK